MADDLLRAVVFFAAAKPTPWWARALKPGFSHCGVVLRTRISWIGIDPLAHWTVIDWFGPWEMSLADVATEVWLRDPHVTATVSLLIEPPEPRARRVMPMHCVESVKRVLGIWRPWIVTPYQLFRHLDGFDGTVHRHGPA